MQNREKPEFPGSGLSGVEQREFAALWDFQWVDHYQQAMALMAEIEDLERSRQRTEALPLPKGELLAKAREHYATYKAERADALTRAFAGWRGLDNPFRQLAQTGQIQTHNGTTAILPALAWEDVERAIESLSEAENCLPEKDRQEALHHIERRLEVVMGELEKIYPKRFRGGDPKTRLVKQWVSTQNQVDAPCTVFGTPLEMAGEAEKSAHRKLGIHSYVRSDAPCRPRRGV